MVPPCRGCRSGPPGSDRTRWRRVSLQPAGSNRTHQSVQVSRRCRINILFTNSHKSGLKKSFLFLSESRKAEAPLHLGAASRGRTFWSQLSSQRCPLLARRFLRKTPSLPSELGNSERRDWKPARRRRRQIESLSGTWVEFSSKTVFKSNKVKRLCCKRGFVPLSL